MWDVPRLVDVVQDELMRPHLDYVDVALVPCPRCSLMLHDTGFGDAGVLLLSSKITGLYLARALRVTLKEGVTDLG